MRRKALLIGNGVSSQIIENLTSDKLLEQVRSLLPSEMEYIEKYFDKFRVSEKEYKSVKANYMQPVVYNFDTVGIDEEDCQYVGSYCNRREKNIFFMRHILNCLKALGYLNERYIYQKYFIDSGLGYEITNKN